LQANEPQPVSVDFSELLDAFEFVSAGRNYEHSAYISVDTGCIYCVSNDVELDVDIPDDLETADNYISVPHKNHFDLGRRLVMSFIEKELPNDWDIVSNMFRRSGAYRQFKDLLHRRDRLGQWYQFEASATEQALRDWCEANDIQLK
jgi:hypothetical protein